MHDSVWLEGLLTLDGVWRGKLEVDGEEERLIALVERNARWR